MKDTLHKKPYVCLFTTHELAFVEEGELRGQNVHASCILHTMCTHAASEEVRPILGLLLSSNNNKKVDETEFNSFYTHLYNYNLPFTCCSVYNVWNFPSGLYHLFNNCGAMDNSKPAVLLRRCSGVCWRMPTRLSFTYLFFPRCKDPLL